MKKVIAIIFSTVWLLALLGCGIYYFAFAPKESHYSEEENRNLAGLPSADFKTVISGDFGEDIEEYFLDNFPGRNYINAKVKLVKSTISIATYEDYLAIAEGTKDPLDDEVDLGDISDLLEETTKPVTKPEKPTEDDSSEPSTDSNEPEVPKENPPIEEKPPVNLEDFKEQYFVYADSGNGPGPILTYEKNNVAAVTAVLNKYAALLPENGKVMFTVAMQSVYLNRFVTPTNQTICYGDWDDMVNSYGANNVYAFDINEDVKKYIKREKLSLWITTELLNSKSSTNSSVRSETSSISAQKDSLTSLLSNTLTATTKSLKRASSTFATTALQSADISVQSAPKECTLASSVKLLTNISPL